MRDKRMASFNAKALRAFGADLARCGFQRVNGGFIPGEGQLTTWATISSSGERVALVGVKASKALVTNNAGMRVVRVYWLKDVSQEVANG